MKLKVEKNEEQQEYVVFKIQTQNGVITCCFVGGEMNYQSILETVKKSEKFNVMCECGEKRKTVELFFKDKMKYICEKDLEKFFELKLDMEKLEEYLNN